MSSNFATAMVDTAKTWNGATSLSTPAVPGDNSSGRIKLFFKSVRGLPDDKLYEYLRECVDEDIIDTFVLAFHIRDCRSGKGERAIGRKALKWLLLNYPEKFDRVYQLLGEYGRWDDLIEFWPGVFNTKDIEKLRLEYQTTPKDLIEIQDVQENIVSYFAGKLFSDYKLMKNGKPISLCAKWAPTENDSYDKKFKTVKTLCNLMNISLSEYRKKYISPLREYLNIVERMMCLNKWSDIEYSKVPSCAMRRLKDAFKKHSPEEFNEWKLKLVKKEAKVNGKQLFPHEIIHEIMIKKSLDIVSEEQWNVIQNHVKTLGTLSNALCVCDVSGSMYGTPIEVATALSIMISGCVSGPFHNHVITFSMQPTFHVLKDTDGLYQKCKSLLSSDWGMNTDLQKVFELILNQAQKHNLSQNDMPKKIFIFSDMQFDQAITPETTNYKEIENRYELAGYKKPDIIFWNLNGSTNDFPVSINDSGTVMLSGFSPCLLTSIMDGKELSSYGVLRTTLDSDNYKVIRYLLEN